MRSAQHPLKEIFGTLRFRLTLWNTAVVLLMMTVTLWAIREGMRLSLWREADEQLVEDAHEVRLTIEQLHPDIKRIYSELDRKAITHTHRGLYIRIFNENDENVWASKNAPPAPFPTSFFSSGLTPVTAAHYRLVHIRLKLPDLPRRTIRVGASFEPIEDDVAQISQLLFIVGVAALLIAPIGGYWLAGRATRPIADIIDTTRRLHPTSLEERLPLRGTRDELDRLSATINGFLDRIGRYLEQNREFTANAAHELRSPLAAIQNSLEVALNSDRTTDEYKDLLAEILDECEGLRVLVNQLLLLAENDTQALRPGTDPVELDHVVRKSVEMFLGVAESVGVSLSAERIQSVRVAGDASRLRQVVNNLLDNAIKFTRPGGRVELGLIANSADGFVRLTVRDTGVGIAPQDLPRIFDRFYRGDKSRQRDRPSRGTGLGLAICQSIVAAHGGRIEVTSQVDVGTTFTISLPRLAPLSSGTPVNGQGAATFQHARQQST